jgi:tRNA(Ile2) C34 agmatinyltransferase TiaS
MNTTLSPAKALEPIFEVVPDKTTASGKAIYRCPRCGYETPAPTKLHQCWVRP